MSGWTIAKYTLVLAGLALIVIADRLGVRWLGYVGLAPIVAAFLLRFVPHKSDPRRKDSTTTI